MIKREYYDNGNPCFEQRYHEGKLHGITKWWYENGQLWVERSYYQGQLHGTERFWSEEGQLENETYHLYEKEVTQEEYREYELIEILSGL